jgi:hypothetical protein
MLSSPSKVPNSSEVPREPGSDRADQSYEFQRPVTFHLGFHVPSIWDDEDLQEVFRDWRSVCKPHRHNFKVVPGVKVEYGHLAFIRMVFTDPTAAFGCLKHIQAHRTVYYDKEAEVQFCGVWVLAQGAGGPIKMLPLPEGRSYSWGAAETLKLQNLILWYSNVFPTSPHVSRKDFPFFGDFYHDYDHFTIGYLLALPSHNRLKPNAQMDKRIDKYSANHPVIVVNDFKDGTVNIVIVSIQSFRQGSFPLEKTNVLTLNDQCTSFNRKLLEVRFQNRPEESKRYLEIDSRQDFSQREDKLKFAFSDANGRYYMPLQTYAGTKAFTVELHSLARFGDKTPISTRVENIEVLLQKMEELGKPHDVRHPMSTRSQSTPFQGSRLALLSSVTPQVKSSGDLLTSSQRSSRLEIQPLSRLNATELDEPVPIQLFPLLVRNLPNDTTEEDLKQRFATWRSVKYVRIFESKLRQRTTQRGVVVFSEDEERYNAIEELQIQYIGTASNGNVMYWMVPWSNLYSKSFLEAAPWIKSKTPTATTTWDEEEQQKWNQLRWDPVSRVRGKLCEGYVVMLPPFRYRRPEFYVDPRIESRQYGCPVMVVAEMEDDLYAVVLVSLRPSHVHKHILKFLVHNSSSGFRNRRRCNSES